MQVLDQHRRHLCKHLGTQPAVHNMEPDTQLLKATALAGREMEHMQLALWGRGQNDYASLGYISVIQHSTVSVPEQDRTLYNDYSMRLETNARRGNVQFGRVWTTFYIIAFFGIHGDRSPIQTRPCYYVRFILKIKKKYNTALYIPKSRDGEYVVGM